MYTAATLIDRVAPLAIQASVQLLPGYGFRSANPYVHGLTLLNPSRPPPSQRTRMQRFLSDRPTGRQLQCIGCSPAWIRDPAELSEAGGEHSSVIHGFQSQRPRFATIIALGPRGGHSGQVQPRHIVDRIASSDGRYAVCRVSGQETFDAHALCRWWLWPSSNRNCGRRTGSGCQVLLSERLHAATECSAAAIVQKITNCHPQTLLFAAVGVCCLRRLCFSHFTGQRQHRRISCEETTVPTFRFLV